MFRFLTRFLKKLFYYLRIVASGIAWWLWTIITIIVIGVAVYVGVALVVFRPYEEDGIQNILVVYRTLGNNNVITITGTIPVEDSCQDVRVDTKGTVKDQKIFFKKKRICNCNIEQKCTIGTTKTFAVHMDGNKDTILSAYDDNVKYKLIVK